VAANAGWFDLQDVSRPIHPRPQQLQTKDAGPPLAPTDLADAGRSVRQPSDPNVPAQGYGYQPAETPQRSRAAEAVAAALAGTRAATVASASSYLGRALALALQKGASDLHAHSGAPILIRIDGTLRPLSGNDPLTPSAADKVIAEVMGEAQKATLAAKGEVDFACEVPGVARMRVNVYRQQRGTDAVFRLVPRDAPTLDQLGLPARLGRLTDFRTGMVLCTGPAGSGKSTTLAALVSGLAQSRADHILTIEDPVEFVYPPGKALVNQRQLREHTSSFARALRAALREDPDVIVITELRDRDTISLAISAAETGHLVLGTLTTGNASQTISRIVSSFSAEEQEQMRVMLAESLRAVISQRLVPKAKGGGRVPAVELLMVNTAVSNLIREDKTHQLPSVMQTGKAAGMMTLDDSLDDLVRAGTITAESARRYAVRKERFGG
jgi:twitching motility protein PilT